MKPVLKQYIDFVLYFVETEVTERKLLMMAGVFDVWHPPDVRQLKQLIKTQICSYTRMC